MSQTRDSPSFDRDTILVHRPRGRGRRSHSPLGSYESRRVDSTVTDDGDRREDVSQADGDSDVSADDFATPPAVSRASSWDQHDDPDPIISRSMTLARNKAGAAVANKFLTLTDTDRNMRYLSKAPDTRIQRSLSRGQLLQGPAVEHAVILRVGLQFLPGADRPAVARLEQQRMSKSDKPDQMNANWRFNTARSLLQDMNVTRNLEWEEIDQTRSIVKSARLRLEAKNGPSNPKRHKPPPSENLDADEPVTIDSDCVQVVHDLRGGEGWDMQATLIEVDEDALLGLMVNYRHIISSGTPDASFTQTCRLLETMMENARRLCVRSPILFRMSTRLQIMHSKNTRYGINHPDGFRTLTTSKGLKEIILISASYFDSLNPAGSSDSTQDLIRPKFLQMIVLLLSFLNNDDLEDISDFLASTYHFCPEREHMEMLFLKVIPLMSINAKVFLRALVHVVEDRPLPPDDPNDETKCMSETVMRQYWTKFVERRIAKGYLIPGHVETLGHTCLSWVRAWPAEGISSSSVFDNLQFADSRCAINDIRPLELHPENSYDRVTAYLTDGTRFSIDSRDVDRITLLSQGVYSIQRVGEMGRNYDLNILQSSLNGSVIDAIHHINQSIDRFNQLCERPKPERRMALTRYFSASKETPKHISHLRTVGHLTVSVAHLDERSLAKAYKKDGRKILKPDCLSWFARDLTHVEDKIREIERGLQGVSLRAEERRQIGETLRLIKTLLAEAEEVRKGVNADDEINEEPIAKLIFPSSKAPTERSIWLGYNVNFATYEQLLHVRAQCSKVERVEWLSRRYDLVEITLQQPSNGLAVAYHATPLHLVTEGTKDDEVRQGDLAVLAGKMMIIAEPTGISPSNSHYMTNYLRLVSINPTEAPSKRGANRRSARTKDELSLTNFI